MLNKAIIMGRITADLELRSTTNGKSVTQFTVAVDRNFVKQGEERQTDFIQCVAWGQTAEFISKFFGKGSLIAVEGRIQTRSYEDKSGNKRTAVEVIVEKSSFTGEKKQERQPESQSEQSYDTDDYDGVLSDEGVPF